MWEIYEPLFENYDVKSFSSYKYIFTSHDCNTKNGVFFHNKYNGNIREFLQYEEVKFYDQMMLVVDRTQWKDYAEFLYKSLKEAIPQGTFNLEFYFAEYSYYSEYAGSVFSYDFDNFDDERFYGKALINEKLNIVENSYNEILSGIYLLIDEYGINLEENDIKIVESDITINDIQMMFTNKTIHSNYKVYELQFSNRLKEIVSKDAYGGYDNINVYFKVDKNRLNMKLNYWDDIYYYHSNAHSTEKLQNANYIDLDDKHYLWIGYINTKEN